MSTDIGWFVSVVTFTVAIVAAPGPNNLMVMASGTNFGLLRTIPHMIGIVIGVPTLFLLINFFGQPMLTNDWLRNILRVCGMLYLVWLAARLAMTRPQPANDAPDIGRKGPTKPLALWQAALFQWINPEVWLAAGAALVSFAYVDGVHSNSNAIKLALIFAAAAIPCVLTWTMMGELTARFLKSERAMVIFNRCLAGLLLLSLIGLL